MFLRVFSFDRGGFISHTLGHGLFLSGEPATVFQGRSIFFLTLAKHLKQIDRLLRVFHLVRTRLGRSLGMRGCENNARVFH